MRIQQFNKVLLIIVLLLFFSCAKKEETAKLSRHGGTVNIALNSAIQDMFPLTTDEFNVEQIHRYMLTPSFVSFDDNGKAIPNLADIWKVDDQNLSITFILNPEMKWSNGKNITTKDVEYSIEILRNLSGIPRYTKIVNNLRSINIIDSLNCQINFNHAVAEPLNFTNFPLFSSEKKYDISSISKFKESYYDSFIGCGPFVVLNYSDDSLKLGKNQFYADNIPYLDYVIFKYVGDSEKLKKLIELRKVDFAVNLTLETTADKSFQKDFNILSYPEKGYTFIAWNLKSRLLKDKNMRLALSHAIDRQTIIDGILGGYSEIIDGPVYYNQKGSPDLLPKIDFNPAKSESLFSDLGWNKINLQGFREKNGRQLSINMMVNKENKERFDIAQNIKANLKSLGVDLQLEFVSWKQLLNAINSKSSDAILLTWTDTDYYDPSMLFHSKAIKDGLNFMSYKSDIADSFIDKALFSWDKKQKKMYWQEFQREVAKDIPCTFLFSQKIIVASNKNIQNVHMDGRGFLVNIKEWWID